MKLFGISCNKFLFHLLSYNISAILGFFSYFLWVMIMSYINPKFLVGSKGYANEIAIINIFILSFLFTFLIYAIHNYKIHIVIIVVVEILSFGIVIFLYYNDKGSKLEGFYNNLTISLPYMMIYSISVYIVQLIIGKKLLPTQYIAHSG